MSATALCDEPVQLRTHLTLEELLTRAHEDAQAYGVGECPVCAGELVQDQLDARCADCGARLF